MRTTGAGQSPLLLLDAVEILDRSAVEYAVIGAMAVAFHGVVRASLDADALLFLKGRPLEPLAAAFRESGFETEVRIGDERDPIPALLALKDGHGNRVDLLAGLRGLDPAAATRTVRSDFEAVSLRVVGLEDLIAMKLYAGGPQDLEDVRRIISLSRTALNLTLLRELALRFGGAERSRLDEMLEGGQNPH